MELNSSNKLINLDNFNIFTDGGAINNKQNAPGGSGVFFLNTRLLVQSVQYGTNNTCELDAIRYALHCINKNLHIFRNSFVSNTVTIYSDSQYAIKAVSGVNKAKANIGLIEKAQYHLKELKSKGIEVEFIYVKAHTKKNDLLSVCNAIVDRVANSAAKELSEGGEIQVYHKVPLTAAEISKLDKLL